MDKFQHHIMVEAICSEQPLTTAQLALFVTQCSHEFTHTYTITYYMMQLAHRLDGSGCSYEAQRYADNVILKADILRYR